MFKLFINNVQVGNYKTYKQMIETLVQSYCDGKITKSMQHKGNSLFVSFYD